MQRGQAMVESVLVLPLVLFLILGTLQLFLMFQGRIMAQYAVFQATRVGSVNHGNCVAMTHAALLSLLPAVVSYATPGGAPGAKLAGAFTARTVAASLISNNHYDPAVDVFHLGRAAPIPRTIFWLIREQPTVQAVQQSAIDLTGVQGTQDTEFDDPDPLDHPLRPGGPMRLETHMVFWFPLRIPFVNWVIARMALAQYGLLPYNGVNPLMPVNQANWQQQAGAVLGQVGDPWGPAIAQEFLLRVSGDEYVFPIQVSYTMRMMTPADTANFQTPQCPAGFGF